MHVGTGGVAPGAITAHSFTSNHQEFWKEAQR